MRRSLSNFVLQLLLALMLAPSAASAAWFDNAWPYRRALEVIWDAERAGGAELAMAEFYTAGHHKPNGDDIRVAADDGALVPSRVLMVGPGDRVRVVFALRKGQRKYFAYFGHADPPAPPKGTDDVAYQCGLLLEVKPLAGGSIDNAQQLEAAWNRGTTILGRAMVREPFLGTNPVADQVRSISKLSGSLYIVQPGEYLFAAAADDRAALFIDGKPVVYAPHLVGDIRFNAKVTLTQGRHDFVVYHANIGGDSRLSVAWQRPDMGTVGVVNKESLGVVSYAIPGAMEQVRKTLTADFDVEYLGESYAAGHYSHRVRFTVHKPKVTGAVEYQWDLGDGQTASGAEVEHVYLAGGGVFPIRLTARLGANADTQTTQLVIGRPLMQMAIANSAAPNGDEPAVHSRIVQRYALDKLPANWLLPAAMLHLRAGQLDAALAAATALARLDRQPNPDLAHAALRGEATPRLAGVYFHATCRRAIDHLLPSVVLTGKGASWLTWSSTSWRSCRGISGPHGTSPTPAS